MPTYRPLHSPSAGLSFQPELRHDLAGFYRLQTDFAHQVTIAVENIVVIIQRTDTEVVVNLYPLGAMEDDPPLDRATAPLHSLA